MELYHLRTFLTVAEEGNLTRASERLFTSQPAVSAHIKALEEELQVQLFLRTPKGMRLSDQGELLLEKAQQVLGAASDLLVQAKSLQGEVTGSVRIGVNTDGECLKLTELLRLVSLDHPHLDLQFIQENSGEIIEDLRHGALDCGFFFGDNPYKKLLTLILAEVGFVVAASARMRDQVVGASWDQIARLPWIYPVANCPYIQIFEGLFKQYNQRPDRIAHASSEPAINALIREGAGLSIMREDEARQMVDQGDAVIWDGEEFTLPLQFGLLASRADEPVIQALIQGVERTWGQDLKETLGVA